MSESFDVIFQRAPFVMKAQIIFKIFSPSIELLALCNTLISESEVQMWKSVF